MQLWPSSLAISVNAQTWHDGKNLFPMRQKARGAPTRYYGRARAKIGAPPGEETLYLGDELIDQLEEDQDDPGATRAAEYASILWTAQPFEIVNHLPAIRVGLVKDRNLIQRHLAPRRRAILQVSPRWGRF